MTVAEKTQLGAVSGWVADLPSSSAQFAVLVRFALSGQTPIPPLIFVMGSLRGRLVTTVTPLALSRILISVCDL